MTVGHPISVASQLVWTPRKKRWIWGLFFTAIAATAILMLVHHKFSFLKENRELLASLPLTLWGIVACLIHPEGKMMVMGKVRCIQAAME